MAASGTGLTREMGLLALVATGACSMVGAAINVIPVMIQRSVPGVGPYVMPAYALAIIPAALAAVAYAILASAMPRAGGSYVYASRSLHPYLGFLASFAQWFGLSIAIGVVSYLLIPFLRDIASALQWAEIAQFLDAGPARLGLALAFLWIFTAINILGLKAYQRALIPLMFLMFISGAVVIPSGFYFDHSDFAAALAAKEGIALTAPAPTSWDWSVVLPAAVILFSTFIGFDAIAQAGGEARNPNRTLPLAIGITLGGVAGYYMLFSTAFYHAVPWNYVAERALQEDLTAPGLLGYLLSPGWTVVIVAGAAIGLINDLPAMLLAVSRLMFAWAEDGIFPRFAARVHPRRHTPHIAIVLSAAMASASILGCHMAGDFFLGVDLLIISMLANFLLMCLSVLALPGRNPRLAAEIRFVPSRSLQVIWGTCGALALTALLLIQVVKDLSTPLEAWYLHSTYLFLLVAAGATAVFAVQWANLKRSGVDVKQLFAELPPG